MEVFTHREYTIEILYKSFSVNDIILRLVLILKNYALPEKYSNDLNFIDFSTKFAYCLKTKF